MSKGNVAVTRTKVAKRPYHLPYTSHKDAIFKHEPNERFTIELPSEDFDFELKLEISESFPTEVGKENSFQPHATIPAPTMVPLQVCNKHQSLSKTHGVTEVKKVQNESAAEKISIHKPYMVFSPEKKPITNESTAASINFNPSLSTEDDIDGSAISRRVRSYAQRVTGVKKPADFSRIVLQTPGLNPELKTGKEPIDEVPCSKCGEMVPIDAVGIICIIENRKLEQHSKKCVYEKGYVIEAVEETLSNLTKINIELSKMHNCTFKSAMLRASFTDEDYLLILKLCKEGEELIEANERNICLVREKITLLTILQSKIKPEINQTAFLHLERILNCLKLKNYQLGQIYKEVTNASGQNRTRATISPAKYSRKSPGQAADLLKRIEEESTPEQPSFRTIQGNEYESPFKFSLSSRYLDPEAKRRKALKFQFYEIYEHTVKVLRVTNPRTEYMNKDKLFEHMMSNNVPMYLWIQTLTDLSTGNEFIGTKSKLTPRYQNDRSTILKNGFATKRTIY